MLMDTKVFEARKRIHAGSTTHRGSSWRSPQHGNGRIKLVTYLDNWVRVAFSDFRRSSSRLLVNLETSKLGSTAIGLAPNLKILESVASGCSRCVAEASRPDGTTHGTGYFVEVNCLDKATCRLGNGALVGKRDPVRTEGKEDRWRNEC